MLDFFSKDLFPSCLQAETASTKVAAEKTEPATEKIQPTTANTGPGGSKNQDKAPQIIQGYPGM